VSDQGLPISRPEREAAEWLARLGRTHVDHATLRDFWQWRRDRENAAAYARAETAWAAAARLAADPDIQKATAAALAPPPPPKPTVTWSPIPPKALGLGLALLCAGLAGGALWVQALRTPTFSTRVGELRTVVLEDGSRVRLNTDSRIEVRFRAHERDVVLARGEAFFDAAHDAARPFVVQAGEARVRALGTRFDVRRDPGEVWVALVEGRVRVGLDHRPDAAVLAPNQQLTVTARGVSAPTPTDATQSTSWTTGRLTFQDVPLAEAIAQVNRYSARRIELDAPLGQARVSGVFDVGDTEAFVAAVREEFDLGTAAGDGRSVIRLVRAEPRPAG
jgi:transmembrane sensor